MAELVLQLGDERLGLGAVGRLGRAVDVELQQLHRLLRLPEQVMRRAGVEQERRLGAEVQRGGE